MLGRIFRSGQPQFEPVRMPLPGQILIKYAQRAVEPQYLASRSREAFTPHWRRGRPVRWNLSGSWGNVFNDAEAGFTILDSNSFAASRYFYGLYLSVRKNRSTCVRSHDGGCAASRAERKTLWTTRTLILLLEEHDE